ncbi:MAG: 2-oxoglutarate dehydrogenase complex dihydrolipoyllysine-residue succinyltransferase [Truepera sp.]|nr:2-oxoglutarate dehydrogenase complex dihydrolipoyllysine-residue succinyltransferase [Truepera sp.]
MSVELEVPSVGESVTEVFIGNWLKREGDPVVKDEPLVEIETDKATLEISATVSGMLSKVLKREGESAAVGEVIALLQEGSPPASEAVAAEEVQVMPAARRLLDEHRLDASDVPSSGPGGRLLKEDVQRHLGGQASSPSSSGHATEGTPSLGLDFGEREEEAVPMSPLRRRIAERLVEAQQRAALLTTFSEIDMSGVIELRKAYRDSFEKRYGVRLGFMSFFVKAVIDALKTIPAINAEIRSTDIVYKNYYDIGVAVSTPRGLIVPVIRNAERLSFAEVEGAIADFGRRAQEHKIEPDELQGGTFTISNGGVFGSLLSTPIVNPPQSGVLGMHAIQERPVAMDGQVVIRPMMYVALSYDHRIVDGREAVAFLRRIKEAVEAPARMLLEV